MAKRGLFVVLEGIDGSGTTSQINFLHDRIKDLSYYNDVLTTHEPWKSDEIKRMLTEDKDAYSSGEKMAELYIEDRRQHQERLIIPVLAEGGIVISDRHALSTYAYQGTQGMSYKRVRELHDKTGIIQPDLTFLLDVEYETAKKRIDVRGKALEKFERNESFVRQLIEAYRAILQIARQDVDSFGNVVQIDGNQARENVAESIFSVFLPTYKNYRS